MVTFATEDEKVICNHCGRVLEPYENYEHLVFTPGYGSKYDTKSIVLSVCYDCFDRFVEQCAVKPENT